MSLFDQIKGFIFDVDGVITDTARFHSQAWHAIADQVGTPWSDDLANRLRGIDRMESLEIILQAGGKASAYTKAQKEELATKKNEHYKELIAGLTPDDILPGIREFLTDLKEHGYQMSIASASHNAPAVLHSLGLDEFFPKIVDPGTLSQGKPEPEIFLKAAAILDLEPRQCVGIEDAVAGIEAIDAAGELSIGIGDKEALRAATMVFPSTSQLSLPNISKQLLGVA
ncbi:beta-phosphoglucomutase [Lacticaseibacillus hulanensis]|uniref:beta-phosphoglucomutase n=1 Tax=Lacticaseibacillus hulanensis TaxID=2493111 RepID=UPI000FDB70EC|nr:beta-phosphoglucomutase [Lacticaseibacillus hulanensis]